MTADPPERFDLHSGKKTDFQDLFIVVAILKNFGLQSIFLNDDKNNKVVIGSYIAQYGGKRDISEGISADTILELPFMTTTNEFLKKCFVNGRSIDSSDDFKAEIIEDKSDNHKEDSDLNIYDDSYDYYDEPDYKRDTFDALTDGLYGDYDEWEEGGGDMDSLRDALGY